MFSSAQNVEVHGGASNTVHGDQYNTSYTVFPNDILDFVASKAAVNAFYNAGQRYPPPNCHPGTRVNVLARLKQWILEESKETRIYWVHGPAGVGKSAIAQKISEEHASPGGRLAASFFFSRGDPTRDCLEFFVPTIVYQLLTSEPLHDLLGPSIREVIRSDPKIFDKSFDYQFRKLIVEPCSRVSMTDWNTIPNLVVIDGVDECLDVTAQRGLLGTIRWAMPALGLVFLIHSRPEPHIYRELNYYSFSHPLGRILIDDSYESNEDILLYLHHRFGELRAKYPSLQRINMPRGSEDVIRQLANKACGQFIFATTVMDFLDCEDDLPGPSERLEAILDPRRHVQAPGSPYSELNLLYRQILSTCRNWEAVRRILSLLVTPHRPLVTPHPFPQCGLYDQQGRTRSVVTWRSPMLLEHFLKLRTGDVRNLLSRLHSVLGVPKNEGSDITVLHTSFVEYLLDPSRSGEYHTEELPESTYFDYVASFLLRQVSLSTSHFPHSSSAESWSSWDDHVTTASQLRRYAFRNSLVFCQQVKSPSKELLAALDQFDPYPSMTMVINLEYMTGDLGLAIRHYFDFWRSAVSWAKSLERKPKVFIRSLESFFNGFTIVAHPEARNFWAGPAAFCESSLAPTSDSSWSEVLHCVSLLGRLFASRDYVGRLGRVYVVPTSTQSPGEGWLRTEVKSRRGKQFNTRAIALFDGSKTREAQSKLLQDIASWTRESVPTLDLVKRTTLHSLTKFVAKRRQDLGLPPYAYNGSDDDSSGMDSPAGSVKGMEVDNAIIAPVPLLAASTLKTSGSVESFYSSGNFRDNRSPIMTHSSGSSPLSDQVSFNRIDSPTPWDSDQGSNASSRGSRSSMASSHRNRSFILTDPIPATGSSRGAWSPVFRQDSD